MLLQGSQKKRYSYILQYQKKIYSYILQYQIGRLRPLAHLRPWEHPRDSPKGFNTSSWPSLGGTRSNVERSQLQFGCGSSEVGHEALVPTDNVAVRLEDKGDVYGDRGGKGTREGGRGEETIPGSLTDHLHNACFSIAAFSHKKAVYHKKGIQKPMFFVESQRGVPFFVISLDWKVSTLQCHICQKIKNKMCTNKRSTSQ